MTKMNHSDGAALQATLSAMKRAQAQDGAPDVALRIDRLTRLLHLLRERAGNFCTALDADFGGRPRDASLMNDVMSSFNSVKYARAQLRGWMKHERRKGVFPFNLFGARVEVCHIPKGVVGVLGTWNVPLFTTLAPLGFVLAAGNRAMIKPSERVPRTSALLQEAIAAYFAADEVAVFTGDAGLASDFSALAFDHLVLTGSSATGVRVMRAAAEHLVPVTLELGGKSPVIIGRSADIRLAAQRIVEGKAMNGGQICVSPDTVYVAQELLEPFVAACQEVHRQMFPPAQGVAALTAVINERHQMRIESYVDDARARGGRIVDCGAGLRAANARLPLRLVIDAPADSTLAQEEIFGPLLQVERYAEVADAIARINAGPRPLALYYFGSDREEEQHVLRSTVSGGVAINDVIMHVAAHDAPFGGIGASGMGAYHGREGFAEFSHARTLYRSGWWDPRKALGLARPYPEQLYARLLKTLRV